MMLTITPARSGHGLLVRDTLTRAQILIDGEDLITVGSALLQHAATMGLNPQPIRPQKGHL